MRAARACGLFVCGGLMLTTAVWSEGLQEEMLLDEARGEAREIVMRFAGQLKPKLIQALQEGGPAAAIAVCSKEAPAIAAAMENESGWQVRRVSLQPRNVDAAQPDTFEQAILHKFNALQASGEDAAELEHAEVINGEFRFMKAQGVEAVCLNCHGQAISPVVANALATHYPGDPATGYSLGEVRGAFSLRKVFPVTP